MSRINEVDVFHHFIEKHKLHLNRVVCCTHTCYCDCVNIASVTSASRYITSASLYNVSVTLSSALSK